MGKSRKIDMVILGLLCHEPLTGYDIKKRIDNSIRFFWKGSFGSIYPALTDMEKTGLIIKNMSSKQTGERERIEYVITETGKKCIRDWLEDSEASNELKYETLLKLFFGGAADAETSIRNIEIFRQNVDQELQLLKLYQKNLTLAPVKREHKYYYLTVLFGVETYETYLKWCDEAVEILKK